MQSRCVLERFSNECGGVCERDREGTRRSSSATEGGRYARAKPALMAVTAGLVVFLPELTATRACDPQPCPPTTVPFECVYGPKKSYCHSSPTSYGDPCECRMHTGTCSLFTSFWPTQEASVISDWGTPPSPPCDSHACGTCYEYREIVCRIIMNCRNDELGVICNESIPCNSRITDYITDKFYVSTHSPCCADAQ